jgi:hypothetical protein
MRRNMLSMKTISHRIAPLFVVPLFLLPVGLLARPVDSTDGAMSRWYLSVQYLGLTYHPNGGNTPEVYPLKLDGKAYLVLDLGVAANLDYRLNPYTFIRLTSALYKDCAFVSAGCIHLGPRFELSWGGNSVNVGLGPIFSFRRDWHRFAQYTYDEFYGDRVYKGWQYRFFPLAVEFEYLRQINDSMEFQWSVIPGGELIVTSLFGIRFRL